MQQDLGGFWGFAQQVARCKPNAHRASRVAEMVARTVIALVLIPVLGYFGAELSNPVAWVAACLFLYPAYLWTVKHLENRLLAGHLAMRHSAVGD